MFKRYYIDEKFKDAFKHQGEVVEVFEDPSTSEIQNILKNSRFKTVRGGITDSKKPKLFVWDGGLATHHDVLDKKIAKFQFGFQTDQLQKTKLESDWGADWNNTKNQDAILKRIKKAFTSHKKLSIWDHVITIDVPLK